MHDTRCETCQYWTPAVDVDRRVCNVTGTVTVASFCCLCPPGEVPFTDDAVGDDEELMAVLLGRR